jgi:hypothetical protein
MHAIVRDDWNALIEVTGGPCASLYASFDPAGRDGQGDVLRWQQLVGKVEQQLVSRKYDARDIHELLKPAYQLPKSPTWPTRGNSFAMLIGPQTLQTFSLDRPVKEEAWGDHYFHVRPLLPFVVESDEFYVLALSENHVHLYEGNAEELRPVELQGLPKNMADAVAEETPDRALQTHSALAGGHGRSGAVFHGHGGKPDTAKVRRHEYIQQVYHAVERCWKNDPRPIVLAMVSEDVPQWRKIAHGVHTLDDFVAGSPEHLSVHELYKRAWPIASKVAKAHKDADFDHLVSANGTRRGLVGLWQTLPAAAAGKIETLFVDSRWPTEGEFDRSANKVLVRNPIPSESTSDLLEEAIRETVLHGGKVFAFDTEEEMPLACRALLRY